MKAGTVLIYLGDLTHTTLTIATDMVPLNIGFLASYARNQFGREVEIRLFKYPSDLIAALKTEAPHILALSHYPWAASLSLSITTFAKTRCQPVPVTVLGGSSYPSTPDQQELFLKERPFVDFFVYLEGEQSFCSLIERYMQSGGNLEKMRRDPIPGCHYVCPDRRSMVRGRTPERLKHLDLIPSPYLSGVLDPFFDGRLTPMIQTNRGCPFTCTFCHEGRDYFNKVNRFSPERVREELAYIGGKMKDSPVKILQIADSNFAMYSQDDEICRVIRQVREKTGWPAHISVTTGKNNHERIIRSMDTIGSGITMSMSVQAMDEQVLSNIRRQNIRLETYMKIHDRLRERGLNSYAEVILGLPGESRETHLQGIRRLVESQVKTIRTYTLMLLDGTELNTPETREKYGLKGRFRVLPRDFGVYDGIFSIEIEEVGVESNSMSFEDYLDLRGFHLMLACYYNDGYFSEVVDYLVHAGVSPFDWLLRLYEESRRGAPEAVRRMVSEFLKSTREELWDSPAAIREHYADPKQYGKLVTGEAGGNLLFNTCASVFASAFEAFLDFGMSTAEKIILEKASLPSDVRRVREELSDIRRFIWHKLARLFSEDPAEDPAGGLAEFDHDILSWKEGGFTLPLSAYRVPPGQAIRYRFVHSRDQERILRNAIRQYGTTPVGLGIILSRAVTIRELFRTPLRIRDAEEVCGITTG